MKLARLLRGAAVAGPGLRAAGPRDRRSFASDSGSGPAAERGVPGQVDFYARFSPSPLSMKQFLDFGECGPSPRAFVARSGLGAVAAGAASEHRLVCNVFLLLSALGASSLPRGWPRSRPPVTGAWDFVLSA